MFQFIVNLTGQHIYFCNSINLISKEFNTNRMITIYRINIQNISAHSKMTTLFHLVYAFISNCYELFKDYITCTKAADVTLVTDIYAAREKDPGDIKAEMVVEGMRENGVNAIHTPTFDDTEKYLREHWQPGDLVLTMGCGNINQLNDQIADHEKAKENK